MRDGGEFCRIIDTFQFNVDGGEVYYTRDIPWKGNAMVCPSINLIDFFVQTMVDPICVAMGDEDGRQVVGYYVRICFVVNIVACCLGFEGLPIPIVTNGVTMFIGIIVKRFYRRIFDYPFHACAKGYYTSSSLFVFLYIGIGADCDNYSGVVSVFCGDDDICLCEYREL